jgi:U3 small nucleolar RNA-associated protein 18
VSQARIESFGGVADFEWWRDSSGLCIVGKNGSVTEWSVEEKRAVARWMDEGGGGGGGPTVIALGGRTNRKGLGGDAWIALGSTSGIVNMYSRQAWLMDSEGDSNNGYIPPNPKPVKVFEQLITPTSCLAFSPDGQVLCMASKWKKNALRLIHTQSCTVYRNWPTGNTPLGRVCAVAWGEIDGLLKLFVGNEGGKVMGWEIHTD